MAQNRFKPGDWNVICQRTGFKIKASEARREWNGLVVRKQSWEPRHPQDFVRGKPDNPSVPWAIVEPEVLNADDSDLLVGRLWEYGGAWAPVTGTAWTKIPEFTFDLVQLRHSSMIPVGSAVQAGETVTLSVNFTGAVFYGGSVFGKIRFYTSDQSTIVSELTAFTFDEYDTTGSFTSSGVVTVPATAGFIQPIFKANGWSGTDLTMFTPSLVVGGTDGDSSTVAYTGVLPVTTPDGPDGDGLDGYDAHDLGT